MKMGADFDIDFEEREILYLAGQVEMLYNRVRKHTQSDVGAWVVVHELLLLIDRTHRRLG